MALLYGDESYLEKTDLTAEIEKTLAQLRSISKMSDEYLALIDNKAIDFVKGSKKAGGEEDLAVLSDKISSNKESKMDNCVSDLELKINSSESLPIGGPGIKSVFTGMLDELKNPTIEKVSEIFNFDEKIQSYSTELLGNIQEFEDKIIKSMDVENLFSKVDELISLQSYLNNGNMSLDKITDLDFWIGDLEDLKHVFKLDELGKFKPKEFLKDIMNDTIDQFKNGELLSSILPSNFDDSVKNILSSLKEGNFPDLEEWTALLPENFDILNPSYLVQNFGETMSGLLTDIQNKINLGEITGKIADAFKELPKNIMDAVDTAIGQIPGAIKDGLSNLMTGLGNLAETELTELMNKCNISELINKIPGVEDFKELLDSDAVKALGNLSPEIANLVNELKNVADLPGSLGDIIDALPNNFSDIVSGLGGIPENFSLDNMSKLLSESCDKIMEDISESVNTIKELASQSLSSLGEAVTGLFSNWGNGEGKPGDKVPQKCF